MTAVVAQLSYLGPSARSAACRRCGRVLRDPVSIMAGIGPTCRRYVGAHTMPEITIMAPDREPVTIPVEPSRQEPAPFLAWYDPRPAVAPAVKLSAALDRHRQRNGTDATVVLAHPIDAAALAQETDLEVRAVASMGRHTYLVGTDPEGRGVVVGREGVAA